MERACQSKNQSTHLGRTSDCLLENSYIPKSEIQELYDQLDEGSKKLVKSYIQGILDTQNNFKK